MISCASLLVIDSSRILLVSFLACNYIQSRGHSVEGMCVPWLMHICELSMQPPVSLTQYLQPQAVIP